MVHFFVVRELSLDIVQFRALFTEGSPWRRVLAWLTVWHSMYISDMLMMFMPSFMCISALVALFGRPDHFLMCLSVSVSSVLGWVFLCELVHSEQESFGGEQIFTVDPQLVFVSNQSLVNIVNDKVEKCIKY